jgi:hypothetical protein
MSTTRCDRELPLSALVDYWVGASTPEENAQIEEHTFECDWCLNRMEHVSAIARAIPPALRRGTALALTHSLCERLEASGLRVRHYRARPGDVIECTVGAEDDLTVSWLGADFTGADRVELIMTTPQGPVLHIEDAPIDMTTNQLVYSLSGDVLRTFPTMTLTIELFSHQGENRRPIAQYTFQHTAYQPG